MKFLELIKIRESIRKYLPKAVLRESLERCLEASRLAPSACNSQSWYFIVVDDKTLKDKLAEEAFSGIYSMNLFVKQAPVIVAVLTERSSYAAKVGGFFKGTQYNLIDIGIAVEHFMLQAAEEGLGTCWIGWFNEKAVKKVLDVPRNKKVDILISVGYPLDPNPREKIRKNLNDIRKYNRS